MVGINGRPSCCERCGAIAPFYAWIGDRWACERCRLASINGGGDA